MNRRHVGPAATALLLTTLVTMGTRGTASAESFSIQCGETKEEAIDIVGEQDSYTFTAAGGETVSITTPNPCSIGFCPVQPCWELFAPPAAPGGAAEAVGAVVCRGQRERTLPRPGVYTIFVFDEAINTVSQTGPYSLTLEAVSGSFNGASNGPGPPGPVCAHADVEGNPDDGTQPINCGETKIGSFEVEGETDTYSFMAAGGETVSITTPNPCFIGFCPVQPCWELFAPPAAPGGAAEAVGAVVCRGQAERTLPRPGVYTIKVFDEAINTVSQTGPYSLTLEAVSGSFNGASNAPPMPACVQPDVLGNPDDGTQPIACGETIPANFEVAGETDSYTFVAAGSETVRISTPVVDGLNPCWRLFASPPTPGDPAEQLGTQVCESTGERTLPRAGTYTILVHDQFDRNIGGYTVTLNFIGPCPCGNGQPDAGEGCDLGVQNGPGSCCTTGCQLVPVGTTCRASAGICDVAETCDGTNATCPANGFSSSSTVCRSSSGICDVAETCSGSSAACPPDGFQPGGTVCRTSAGICDVAETCNGASPSCPADGFASSSTVCRPATGACDVAETCTGSSATCPGDVLAPSSIVCRSAAGACDVAETCTGSSSNCPPDVLRGASTVCRTAAGTCDVAESCDGTSPTCPSDAFEASTTICRSAAGVCDVADHCTGTSAACPADGVAPSTTVCRASTGICDVAEHCTGTSAACPVDGFAASSTVCRPATGLCDIAEHCPGMGSTCPVDALASAGTVCRPAAGACDVVETCTGASVGCPADTFALSGTLCRAAAGVCDVAESCTGSNVACPADLKAPNGTTCDDGLFCTVSDQCTGGACAGAPRICDDGDPCTTNACDESLDQCTASASSCDDGNPCTDDACASGNTCTHTPRTGEACAAGDLCRTGTVCQADATCGGGTPKNCSALDDACTKGVCDPRDGECVEQPADEPQCTDACVLIKGAIVCPTCDLVCGTGSCVPESEDACSIGLPTPPVIVIIVIGAPGASCKVRIREIRPGQNALGTRSDVLKAKRPKRPRVRGKSASIKIAEDGRVELPTKVKLNPIARKLFDEGRSLAAEAKVTIRGKGGKKLLKRLITLVKSS